MVARGEESEEGEEGEDECSGRCRVSYVEASGYHDPSLDEAGCRQKPEHACRSVKEAEPIDLSRLKGQ